MFTTEKKKKDDTKLDDAKNSVMGNDSMFLSVLQSQSQPQGQCKLRNDDGYHDHHVGAGAEPGNVVVLELFEQKK